MPIDASPSGTLDIENATLRSREIVALTSMVTGNDVIRSSNPPALEVYGDPSHGGNEARLELVSNTATVSSKAFTQLTSNAGVLSIKTGTDASDNGTITFGGFSNERMRIGSDGNVGIGTTSPDGKLHIQDTNPLDFKGITYTSSDVKTVITNDASYGTNASMIQVYKLVTNRTPSAIDFHSEENFNASNVYTLCLNPRGGRIGLNDMNPNSDLTIGARFYNTKGYVGIISDGGNPVVYKGDPTNTTTTLPYTQLSTSNPTNGPAYYFVNPYPGEAQCTVVYDNALSSASGLIYFYCNGPGHQPSTYLANSSSGNSEFTIPLQETTGGRGIRINAVHMKPVNGTQIRIVAVYWVPHRGVTANIKDGGKLVLGTVGGYGTPGGALTFRSEYETPTGNELEPRQRLDNGIAWMTDLSTWYNPGLGGNGINWNKNNDTYGVSVGARIWYQPGSFISAGGGAGNCGSLYLSAGISTAASNTPSIAIKSNGNVGIGITNPPENLTVQDSGIAPTFGLRRRTYNDYAVYMKNTTGNFITVTTSDDTVLNVGKGSGSNRSINALGTINASGTDYAEYMKKSRSDLVIKKGDIVGINNVGELTNVFSESIQFVVKSTDPSYVGGDSWNQGTVNTPKYPSVLLRVDEYSNISSQDANLYSYWEEQNLYANTEQLNEYYEENEKYLEDKNIHRDPYDRIAYCGQVPVNVYNATPGQYIVPSQANDDTISCELTNTPTFEQYQISIGKVIKIQEDGRAWAIVKIS